MRRVSYLAAMLTCIAAAAAWPGTAEPAEIIELTPLAPAGDAGAPPADRPAPAYEALWTGAPRHSPPGRVNIAIDPAESAPAHQPLPLHFEAISEGEYPFAEVRIAITDAAGAIVNEGALPLSLNRGHNPVRFAWNAARAAPGRYRVLLEIAYSRMDPAAWLELTVTKASDADLRARLSVAARDVAELDERMQALAASGALPPYQHLRTVLARETLLQARQDAEKQDWRALEEGLAFLESTTIAIRAGLALSGAASELRAPMPERAMQRLAVREGNFFADGQPVYLFGMTLEDPDPAAMQRLTAYGLNLAVLDFGPERGKHGDAGAVRAELDTLLNAAKAANVSVQLRLRPDRLDAATLARHPGLQQPGYVDIALDPARLALRAHVAALAPALDGNPIVNSISIAERPHFAFGGETVRQGFIDHVRAMYPDRHSLNQTWRAHLGRYQDIQIGAPRDGAPYMTKRAYQADWQRYNRTLALRFTDWAANEIRQRVPGARLQMTAGDSAFERGESRWGIEREALAHRLDQHGVSGTAIPHDPMYAFQYPGHAIHYALARAMAPDKPVFNNEQRFVIDTEALRSPSMRAAFVRSVVWDSFITGLSAMAVPSGDPIFDYPETIEAFAAAGMDVNRLAPIVHAFQNAPVDIAVLWSDSAKIFDDGDPYLQSALHAYEGCSFGGYHVRFVTEQQCAEDALEGLPLAVIPHTLALDDAAFAGLARYIESGGTIARVGMPIPYDKKGQSRQDILRNTANTILVRGMNLPTEYLHAVDAAIESGVLPAITRPINQHGYPLEGVKTRTILLDGKQYLYVLNLRQYPVMCHLTGAAQHGRDLIAGRTVDFPRVLEPLDPMLIVMEPAGPDITLTATGPGRAARH